MGISNFTSNNNGSNPNPPSGGAPVSFIAHNDEFDVMSILIDYNDRFAQAGPAMFRENIVLQTLGVLIGQNKPNAILIGPAGTGKTKIVEDIAWRLANDDTCIPDQLKNMKIYELPLSALVSGSRYAGDIEKKTEAVIEFASDAANNTILFIDEIHQLGGENDMLYSKIAQILKPALARGDIRVIGATTLQEAEMLYKDPAFNRRFSRIIVDELTNEQTIQILEQMLPSTMAHYKYGVAIDKSILISVVNISNRFAAAGNHRPDTAITLLDRACGDAIVAYQHTLAELETSNPQAAQALKTAGPVVLDINRLKKSAIRIMSGQSKAPIFTEESLKEYFTSIKGQDEAVDTVVKHVIRDSRGLFPRKRPMSFIFAGSSGCGKTEIARKLADAICGTEPIIINMPEYHSSASINRIIGSPAGYVGSDSTAEMPLDALDANPYQVILLDEFEKGCKDVQQLFMSALDDGYIKTARGKTIDFSRTIIIATTNAGSTDKAASERTVGFLSTNKSTGSKRLRNYFAPELLNRFTQIIDFNQLNKDVYKSVLIDIYDTEAARINSENIGITLPEHLTEAEVEQLADKTYNPDFGARPARKCIENYIESIA